MKSLFFTTKNWIWERLQAWSSFSGIWSTQFHATRVFFSFVIFLQLWWPNSAQIFTGFDIVCICWDAGLRQLPKVYTAFNSFLWGVKKGVGLLNTPPKNQQNCSPHKLKFFSFFFWFEYTMQAFLSFLYHLCRVNEWNHLIMLMKWRIPLTCMCWQLCYINH